MYRRAADEGSHGVLRRKKLKLYSVLPTQTGFEQITDPFNALGFASTWDTEETISQWLAGLKVFRLVGTASREFSLFCQAASNHPVQESFLFGTLWLRTAFEVFLDP